MQLNVCDVLGRKVKTLVNKLYSPDKHKFSFDASDQSTVIYFQAIKIGNLTITEKMLLVK